MILVFGGTTEGKKVSAVLESLSLPYVYSTKTKVDVELGTSGTYRFGAFDPEALRQYILANKIQLIIDAAHPFAIVLHQTVITIAKSLSIRAIRVDRPVVGKLENSNVFYVQDYDEAMTLLHTLKPSKVLALTGVQSIALLEQYWKKKETWFRILNRESSIELAKNAAFPVTQLLLGYPNKNTDQEVALYKKGAFDCILTKDSGDSGALTCKIEAAITLGISLIIMCRPALPLGFESVTTMDALAAQLTDIQ